MLSIVWLFIGAPFAQNFSQNWALLQDAPGLVKTAILEANDEISPREAKKLSKQIVRSSRCLDLDPILFTALVWRESHFRHQSMSETGAVGLTQLTKTGIHEVLDRLGADSVRRKEDLRRQVAYCYPQIFRSIPSRADFVDLSEWKKKVVASPELALVFGAVLLKSNLTSDYRGALEKYNGDPRVKIRFAQDVLTLGAWISSSFIQMPNSVSSNSKFLTSIQGF